MNNNNFREQQVYVNKYGSVYDEKGFECFEVKVSNTYKCSACKYYKYSEAFWKNEDRSTGVKAFCKCCDNLDSLNRYYDRKDK